MGEPLKVVGMKWKIGNGVQFNGTTYTSDGSAEECTYIPQSVINRIEIIDLEIEGTVVGPGVDDFNNPIYLHINADTMFKPGNGNQWGKSNLTLPASPDWDGMFYSSRIGSISQYWSAISGKDAKNIMRKGFSLRDIKISHLSFNMTPVRLWLLKNKCDENEIVQEALTGTRELADEKVPLANTDTENSTSLFDDVTKLWDELTTEETDFEKELSEAGNTDDTSFESQLAGVESHRDALEKERQKELLRQAEIERKRQEKIRLESERLAKLALEDKGYVPFRQDNRDALYTYGFKKDGATVIGPTYHLVSHFKYGVALVCLNSNRNYQGSTKWAFIDKKNNIMSGWHTSKAGGGCNGIRDTHNGTLITKELKQTIKYTAYEDSVCGNGKIRTDKVKWVYKYEVFDVKGKNIESYLETEYPTPGISLCAR